MSSNESSPPKAPRKRRQLDPLTVATLPQVLRELHIAENDWDILLVGDGSGTGWTASCAWAVLLVEHYRNYRKLFTGNWSHGSSHIAELLPYIQALTWHAGSGEDEARQRADKKTLIRVHIISDNATIVNQGNRAMSRSSYEWLWDALTGLERRGYILTWHWLERNLLALNRLADTVAVRMRVAAQELTKQLTLEEMAYNLNPMEDDHGEVQNLGA